MSPDERSPPPRPISENERDRLWSHVREYGDQGFLQLDSLIYFAKNEVLNQQDPDIRGPLNDLISHGLSHDKLVQAISQRYGITDGKIGLSDQNREAIFSILRFVEGEISAPNSQFINRDYLERVQDVLRHYGLGNAPQPVGPEPPRPVGGPVPVASAEAGAPQRTTGERLEDRVEQRGSSGINDFQAARAYVAGRMVAVIAERYGKTPAEASAMINPNAVERLIDSALNGAREGENYLDRLNRVAGEMASRIEQHPEEILRNNRNVELPDANYNIEITERREKSGGWLRTLWNKIAGDTSDVLKERVGYRLGTGVLGTKKETYRINLRNELEKFKELTGDGGDLPDSEEIGRALKTGANAVKMYGVVRAKYGSSENDRDKTRYDQGMAAVGRGLAEANRLIENALGKYQNEEIRDSKRYRARVIDGPAATGRTTGSIIGVVGVGVLLLTGFGLTGRVINSTNMTDMGNISINNGTLTGLCVGIGCLVLSGALMMIAKKKEAKEKRKQRVNGLFKLR
jgi:hypothetical protein